MEKPEFFKLSNKREFLIELFAWLDFRGLGRINTLELFAVIIISAKGTGETMINNIMLYFGFQSRQEFYRDELHFFFDCLFRGLCNLVITRGNKMPMNRGTRVNGCEIAKLVKKVFVGDKTESYEQAQFIIHYSDSKPVKELL